MDIHKRQLWGLPTKTSATITPHCTPFTLPSNGVISLKDSVITLTTNVIFQPECTGSSIQDVSSIADLKDPFYASTIPQTYVIAAATVIAWILVVMLVITPRTNFLGHSGAAPGFNSGHGIIGGATGGVTNLIGVGSRPWLQKVAALTVAISLTIATADTFYAAEEQYLNGYMDATGLRKAVIGSLEIRITRVISDIFLWLAQVQTLIRLFPRHKEKVLIKWIGFALILLDTMFSCLNAFLINTTHQPRQFVDAIPALSYLFELALALLYAAWVIYYSLTKRRYAFYHPKMRSIVLISTLSLVAVLTPVVFFVTDICNRDIAGWGDYFRWVGAAAASVVVWEWVERIEALERDEKKDGILGREIFDGDEMLDASSSENILGMGGRRQRKDDKGGDGTGGAANHASALERGFGTNRRFRHKREPQEHFPLGRCHSNSTSATPPPEPPRKGNGPNGIAFGHLPRPSDPVQAAVLGGPTPPPAVASPVSRADTTSAASTVYVVQYDATADIAQPVRRRVDVNRNTEQTMAQSQAQRRARRSQRRRTTATDPGTEEVEETSQPNRARAQAAWYSVANPFKRKRASPPAEVQQARRNAPDNAARVATPAHNFSPWDIKNRIGVLAAETGELFRDRQASRRPEVDFPVTVIPAQPRGSGRAWTPAVSSSGQTAPKLGGTTSNESPSLHNGSGSTTLTANSEPAPTVPQPPAGLSRVDDASPLATGVHVIPHRMAALTSRLLPEPLT
ncbi:pH-response regulator protein palH/rim21 [Vermiconidia calcicola]|uniref:PH-response regulator protein palH/rim21 n=1 Tax=Vermiconidia calcicola TaxID=1690605 RepID=A0ACC3MVW4_9PEZI|nr:pH-response regulator protein palH/rim21 [Vermiconidia calcicola]